MNLTLAQFKDVCQADNNKLQRQWLSFVVAALVMYRVETIRGAFLKSGKPLGAYAGLYGETVENFNSQLDELRDVAQKMRIPMPVVITASEMYDLYRSSDTAVAT